MDISARTTLRSPLGVILAGGKGERIKGEGVSEKPLALINGVPIVLHAARSLGLAGVKRVVVLTGQNHQRICQDPAIGAGFGLLVENGTPLVAVEFRFSGSSAGTAGRLLVLREDELSDGALVSYSDVLTSAPLKDLWSDLGRCNAELSVLAVNPVEPWGTLEIRDGFVKSFKEKKRNKDVWINSGFFGIGPNLKNFVQSKNEMLEIEVMDRLVFSEKVVAQQFQGWWTSVDTQKDLKHVNKCPQARAYLSRNLTFVPSMADADHDTTQISASLA